MLLAEESTSGPQAMPRVVSAVVWPSSVSWGGGGSKTGEDVQHRLGTSQAVLTPGGRGEQARGEPAAPRAFLILSSACRFGASQTSESSSKSDLENGDHDGSVDSEEEEETEQQPPPSSANSNKNNISEQKDSDSSEGKELKPASIPLNRDP